jgi:ABC-type transporter Mla subunit MlaD
MALHNVNINLCPPGAHEGFETLNKKIDQLIMSLQTLAKEVTDLRAQVTDLQTTIDTEQDQIRTTIDTLNTNIVALNGTIQQLQDQLANGATPEQLDALQADIIDVRNNLTTAKEDLAGTIPDAPQEPGNGEGTNGGETTGGQTPTTEPATGEGTPGGVTGNQGTNTPSTNL